MFSLVPAFGSLSAKSFGFTNKLALVYATWNPLDKGTDISLSGGNLTATNAAGSFETVRATISKSVGKWYWEVTQTTVNGDFGRAGVCSSTTPLNNYAGASATGWDIGVSGVAIHNGATTTTGVTYAAGDKIGVAWDAGAGNLWFAKNNVWVLSGNPSTGSNPLYTSVTGTLFPCTSMQSSNALTLIPGPTLTYSPPTGFSIGIFR